MPYFNKTNSGAVKAPIFINAAITQVGYGLPSSAPPLPWGNVSRLKFRKKLVVRSRFVFVAVAEVVTSSLIYQPGQQAAIPRSLYVR